MESSSGKRTRPQPPEGPKGKSKLLSLSRSGSKLSMKDLVMLEMLETLKDLPSGKWAEEDGEDIVACNQGRVISKSL